MVQAGCGAQIWGQTRCPIYRSGTFNVKRSTLNFQRGDRKGRTVGWIWGQTRNLDERTLAPGGPGQVPADWSRPDAAARYGDRHDVRYTDQERSTSNVQLATFNGVTEKGPWRSGYGDRHRVLPVGGVNRGTGTIFGPGVLIFDTSELTQPPVGWSNRAAAPTYGDRHDV